MTESQRYEPPWQHRCGVSGRPITLRLHEFTTVVAESMTLYDIPRRVNSLRQRQDVHGTA